MMSDNTSITTTSAVSSLIEQVTDDSAIKDFEKTRANITEFIEVMNDAIVTYADIARSSQDAKAYEVLAKLVSTGIAANRNLLETQEKIRKINNAGRPTTKKTSETVNNVFLGSTADLQNFLDKKKKTIDG